MIRTVVSKRRALTGLATIAVAATTGCERAPVAPAYQAVTGVVETRLLETGELMLRAIGREQRGDELLHCQLTKDTEVYVNDRFTTIQHIEQGDSIELIGYRDPAPQADRFVVTYAYVRHPQEPPPLPKELKGVSATPNEKG